MDMLYESQCADVIEKLKAHSFGKAIVDGYNLTFWWTGKVEIHGNDEANFYSTFHIKENVRDIRKCPTGLIMHFILRVKDGWNRKFD